MSRRPDAYPFFSPSGALLRLILFAMLAALLPGCGDVGCPDSFVDADGVCVKRPPADPNPNPAPTAERCDGVDNDLDDGVDEDWPELGKPCGEAAGIGECVAGAFVCTDDGAGTVCEGAVGPTAEVCDGKDNDCDGVPDNGPDEVCDGEDNDCDGLVDEGVLAVKKESVFRGLGSVAAVDGGFAVAWLFNEQLRIETYDEAGSKTGHFDSIPTTADVAFIDSDANQGDFYITWGKYQYHAALASIDASLVPVIVDSRQLHESWDQPVDISLGTFDPPFHPRVAASPPRLVGYRDLVTFAIVPLDGGLVALTQEPTLVGAFPYAAAFDAAGLWTSWEDGDNIRGALLRDDGSLTVEIDIGRGDEPSLAVSREALGVASVFDGGVRLAELDGFTLQCKAGLYCNASLSADELLGTAEGPTALAFNERSDSWFVAVGRQIIVVGRDNGSAVVNQLDQRLELASAPNRIDVAVSGDTAAVMQSTRDGDSALTFLGCF